ncbi:hypothetical protein [Micromonospora sp. AP08]|uniref:hypothetical protein n=1 Tax=Micromonospora sp. AP08 TaxID=2604467 RepID=UPI001651CFB5|nr:hypothetical protein [Micromonospora sp. AP08]
MSAPEILVDGLAFGESPRWHDGRLWLADWGAGEVLTVDAAGRAEVVARVDGLPICFDWLPGGPRTGQVRTLRAPAPAAG